MQFQRYGMIERDMSEGTKFHCFGAHLRNGVGLKSFQELGRREEKKIPSLDANGWKICIACPDCSSDLFICSWFIPWTCLCHGLWEVLAGTKIPGGGQRDIYLQFTYYFGVQFLTNKNSPLGVRHQSQQVVICVVELHITFICAQRQVFILYFSWKFALTFMCSHYFVCFCFCMKFMICLHYF